MDTASGAYTDAEEEHFYSRVRGERSARLEIDLMMQSHGD